jgi:alkylhydroperoxidase family enzyme
MADISAARAALTRHVLGGAGTAPQDQRRAAYANEGPPKLRPLIDRVTREAPTISDADIAAAKAAGFTEDQIFELVVCAAVGEATRQYESALAALATAAGGA